MERAESDQERAEAELPDIKLEPADQAETSGDGVAPMETSVS